MTPNFPFVYPNAMARDVEKYKEHMIFFLTLCLSHREIFKPDRFGFKSAFCLLLAMWPASIYISPLSINFPSRIILNILLR